MQFRSVVIKNFLSFEYQSIDFEKTAGLTLIEGENFDEGDSNGSGKSSIWDGIAWCLFGNTVRGVKGDEVVRRSEGCDCYVEVRFLHDGCDYRVCRWRRDKKNGNAFQYYVNEKRVEEGTVLATQKRLLKELDIDFDLFRCTVIFAQGETFNFVNETDKKQKEILSKVRKIDLSDALQKIKNKTRDIESEVDNCGNKIELLMSHIEDDPGSSFKSLLDDWEADRKTNIESIQDSISDFQNKLDSIEKDIGDIKGVRERKAEIQEQLDKLKELADKVRNRMTKELTRAGMSKEQVEKFRSLHGECPTCKTPVKPSHIEPLIKKEKKRIAVYTREADKFKDKWSSIKKMIDENDEKLMEQNSREVEIKGKITRREEYKTQLKKYKAELQNLKKATNPFIAKIKEAKEKQKRVEKKIKELDSKLKQLESLLPYYLFWENACSDKGVKSFVFDTMCSALTNRANYYLNILTNGSVTISFDTQTKLKSGETREKFECIVMCDGEKIPYSAYSGGEKRRISLAVDMSLCALMTDYYGSSFNIVVFDEQDYFLDGQGRENFLNLLKDLSKEKHVFVVSHDNEFKSRFDNVWTVKKKDGVSYLEVA